MRDSISEEIIKKAILMSLANVQMEEDVSFDIDNKEMINIEEKLKQKVKQRGFYNDGYLGWLFNRWY